MSSMITAAVITYAGTKEAIDATKKEGKRGRGLQREAMAEDTRQYEQTREDWAPWREAGKESLAQLGNPVENFLKSPGYEFIRNEGTRNMENVFSAKGGGGNAMRALNEYNSNLAAGDYNMWWGRQLGKAGLGSTGTQATTVAGMNKSNNIGQNYDDMASIGMWGTNQQLNAMNSGISNVLYGMKDYASGWTPKTKAENLPAKKYPGS